MKSLDEVAKDILLEKPQEQSNTSFKDMQVVDYTFSDGTDYDPDGILSRMAKKRKGEIGGGPVEP